MIRVILIGYMGAGKTTVGKALAKELNVPFYDLDWYIETRMHRTVKQLFDERGEEGFRKVERNMLHEVAECEKGVLSWGGVTPCLADNVDYMNEQGQTVYLKARPEVLYQHLKMGRSVRPLLLGKSPQEMETYIREQLAHREQYYSRARHTLDVSLMDNFDKINITVTKLRELLKI